MNPFRDRCGESHRRKSDGLDVQRHKESGKTELINYILREDGKKLAVIENGRCT